MVTQVERVGNLLSVINEYEKIFNDLKTHVVNAKKSSTLEKRAISIIYMLEEANLSPATFEILAYEKALFKVNAPRAAYRLRKRKEKKTENLSINKLESYDEFNQTAEQDLNDYSADDDI
jgi:hypothetical protein